MTLRIRGRADAVGSRRWALSWGGTFLGVLAGLGHAALAASAVPLPSYHVGLEFLDAPRAVPELPQAQFVGGEWLIDDQYRPLPFTTSSNQMVLDGGLAGRDEAQVREQIRYRVEAAFRAVDAGAFDATLRLNIYNGPAPATAAGRRLNVVVGVNSRSGDLYGWSQINSAFNSADYPDGSVAAAVFVDNLDRLGLQPGIAFDAFDKAINHVAGTIAHEIAHLFGLDHEPAGSAAPYSIMATGGTGLAPAMRLTERRFSAESQASLRAGVPSVSRGDFNMDGDVDVFQFDGRGDAQILVSNLGVSSGAMFSEGDANSDGDVDVFQFDGRGDAQMLVSALTYDAPESFAALLHDAASGGWILELGPAVGVLAIVSPDEPFLASAACPSLGAPAQLDASTIAFFDPAGLPAGRHLLTGLWEPGSTPAGLQLFFTPLGAMTRAGSIAAVPEPHAGVWCLLPWALRRRRA